MALVMLDKISFWKASIAVAVDDGVVCSSVASFALPFPWPLMLLCILFGAFVQLPFNLIFGSCSNLHFALVLFLLLVSQVHFPSFTHDLQFGLGAL